MKHITNDIEQIFSVLRRLKSASPTISIAKHIELATRNECDLFYLDDLAFLDILEKYELENAFDPVVDEDKVIDDIIDEATNHFPELVEELLHKENGD